MKTAEFAIRNYQFTIVLILLLVVAGLAALLTMPRAEDPQVAPPGTTVIVIYPGASPVDMEQLVVDPIEEKLNELDDIKRIQSHCSDGLATTEVEFHTNVDMDDTYSKIVQKINSIRADMPEDIADLTVQRWTLSDHVIVLQLALLSETESFKTLGDEAERLKKMLERIYEVKRIRTYAIPEQQVRISLNLAKLAQRGISINQVIGAIQSSNANIPGGNLDIKNKRYNLKTSGFYRSLEEMKDTVVYAFGEKVVFLGEIADVSLAYEDNTYLARTDGKRCVYISINQKEDTNILSMMEKVREQLTVFADGLPPSITLETVFDQSKGVARRLNSFLNNLLQGLVLVGIVVFFAVGLRGSVIVMMAIPISILISIGFIDLSRYGLQSMSIAGLVIALGLLVDNAIVVTENISRFIKTGYSAQQASIEGTRQIGGAIISSTVTTVLAFLPIAMMGYVTGDYIRSMPMTVIYTLSASLLVALTLTPYLSSRFLRVREDRREPRFRKFLEFMIVKTYRPTLDFALKHSAITIICTLFLFLLSLFLFRFVGISFFPKAEKPQLIVNIDMPDGSSIARTDEVARYVEGTLAKRKEILSFATNIGHSNPQIHYNLEPEELNIDFAQIFVQLTHFEPKMMAALVADLRNEFNSYAGASIEIKELEQGPPVEAPVAVKILGENLEALLRISRDMEAIFLSTEGTINVHNPQKSSVSELRLHINRAKAGMLGIPMLEIDRTIRACIAGMTISHYRDEEGQEYDIVARLPYDRNISIEDLDRISFTSLTGTHIPLSQVASLEFKSSPKQIEHYRFERAVTITSDVETGFSTDKVTRAIIDRLERYPWPRGYQFSIAGEMESQQESFAGMGRAIIIAMIAIFAVLVLQFRSFKQPLIVFVTIPLAIIGSIYGLLITGNTFSFTAFIGLTSLIGIVVNNAIILVDYSNRLKAAGKPLIEALKEAGETRFVPIILTTATTIGGLLPLTLRGGTMYGPMGWTIIGGLSVSTFFTTVMVPVMYKGLATKENGA